MQVCPTCMCMHARMPLPATYPILTHTNVLRVAWFMTALFACRVLSSCVCMLLCDTSFPRSGCRLPDRGLHTHTHAHALVLCSHRFFPQYHAPCARLDACTPPSLHPPCMHAFMHAFCSHFSPTLSMSTQARPECRKAMPCRTLNNNNNTGPHTHTHTRRQAYRQQACALRHTCTPAFP